ncbi:hypothetical protein A4G99_03715 [Haladaptatus sp. R4]|uniref:hypothetical protein n=1 Tax=Haladaptatus sp. R4 TaxID=1679489 RepID=UPI0007B4AFC9|nr:hypothetical protein [Haladaptatus sp. R4]KZN25587.1 hypothetical protein A4G99_03715 [Haladaptatus sp. R4]
MPRESLGGVGLGLITHGLPPYILANSVVGLIAGALGVLYLPYFMYLNVTAIRRSESGGDPMHAWPLLVGVTFGLGVVSV